MRRCCESHAMATLDETMQCEICWKSLSEEALRGHVVLGCSTCASAGGQPRMHRACLARWHYRQSRRDERPSCPRCRGEVDAAEIRLKTLTGNGFLVRVPSDGTVCDLMLASALHVGLSCEIQRLVYDGSQLEPDAPLPAMADDAVVHVVPRVRSLKMQLANEAAGGVIPHPDAPAEMTCPISRGVWTDPVACADGNVYSCAALAMWMAKRGNVSPMNNRPLLPFVLDADRRAAAEAWLATAPPAPPPRTPPQGAEAELTIDVWLPEAQKTQVTVRLLDDDSRIHDSLQGEHADLFPDSVRVIYKNFLVEEGVALWRYGVDGTSPLVASARRS